VEFDSYLVPESDLEEGALRMLEVDNRVILTEVTHTGLEHGHHICLSTSGDGGNTGNTFSTPNDDIGRCEHPSIQRVVIADCSDFVDNPVDCSYCDKPALNVTEGQQAISCHDCGVTICETCNEPNYDSGKDE
jgi:hypothetical protein